MNLRGGERERDLAEPFTIILILFPFEHGDILGHKIKKNILLRERQYVCP